MEIIFDNFIMDEIKKPSRQNEWLKKNPIRAKEIRKKYYEKNKEILKIKAKKRYQKNREKKLEELREIEDKEQDKE